MTLKETLNKKTNKMLTFYHISTKADDFKSFFREGAKSVGQGIGGQTGGFYVWSNKKAAEEHIRFLNKNPFSEKELKNNEVMIIGVDVPQKDISYPLWQQDYEKSVGIFELWIKYGDFLNKKALNLDIPFSTEDKPLGWDFEKITGFSYEKRQSAINQQDYYNITFKGISESGKEKEKIISRTKENLTEGGDGAYDSVKFQILTDWLCQNNPDFKKDYDTLIQKAILKKEGYALKYTGTQPLIITFAEYVKIKEDGSLKKTTVFNSQKGSNQICPFFTIEQTRTRSR